MKNIEDIAKIAGVSKSTVSRYLNNGSVSNKTKQKLDKIISENNYQPNQFAQSLRARRTNMVGAIIPRMNSFAVDETIQGVKTICDNLNYRLLLNYTNLDIEKEIDALETFNRSKVDGIIFMATEITGRHLEVINKIDVPVIIVGQAYTDLNCVIHDDYRAGYLVGKYIGEKGFTCVQFFGVTESDEAVGIQRKEGLIDGLKVNGVMPQMTLTSFNFKEAMPDVKKTLNASPDLEVVIGATDSIALAVHKVISEQSNQMFNPMVVGFGGDPVTEIVSPSIQTVLYHFEEAGEVAMNQLEKLIQHVPAESKILIDVSLSFKI